MDLGLTGKVALVTGGSRGIGRAIAAVLAREGVRVAICARSEKALQATADALRKDGAEIYAATADISNQGDIERVIADVVARWGGLDILVNNAGGPPPGRFDALEDGNWHSAVELSLMSTVRMIRAALPHLRQSAAGRVINILSTSVREPLDGMILSNSLRAAVAGLAKTMSRELGRENPFHSWHLPSTIRLGVRAGGAPAVPPHFACGSEPQTSFRPVTGADRRLGRRHSPSSPWAEG